MANAINMKQYIGKTVEQRTEILQAYIEENTKKVSLHKNKHTGKGLADIAEAMAQTDVNVYSQLTESTKLLTDLAMALNEDDKKMAQNLVYTLQLMNEQNRMLILADIAIYTQDTELQLQTVESLVQTLGGEA